MWYPSRLYFGPLLFLIYINDLHHVSKELSFILFADDTNLFYSHKNERILNETLNLELKKLSIWFRANKLSLNVNKTKYMKFLSTPRKRVCDMNLFLDDYNIEKVNKIKFLGVIIDDKLNWSDDINYVADKIPKSVGIL